MYLENNAAGEVEGKIKTTDPNTEHNFSRVDFSAVSSEASTDANMDGALPTAALTNALLNGSPPSLELREGDLVHIECAQAQPREG